MDVKTTSGVYFYVGRNSFYSTIESVIPYDVTRLNIGGAMNLASGVFTAPVSGRYHINFVAVANADRTGVFLRLNGNWIAFGWGMLQNDDLAITATLELQKGDTIDTFLNSGSIADSNSYYDTQFTGVLLEEDLVL